MNSFRNDIDELNCIFNTLLKNSKDYLFVKDTDSIYVAASDNFAKLFGYNSGEEIIGMDAVEVSGNVEAGQYIKVEDYKIITTGEPIIDSLEEGERTGCRMKCILSTSKYPVIGKDGNVIGILGVVSDITSTVSKNKLIDAYRTSLDAAASANQAKSDFLSKMSHDIRTPMNAIIGMTALAQANLNNPEKVKYNLDKVLESGKYLLSLVNEVLDMEKIESGKVELNVCDFDIRSFLDNFHAMMLAQAKDKNLSFTVNAENLPHTRVVGDPTRLEQIFTNLASNAIKFTNPGGSVRIAMTEKEAKNGVVNYDVVFEDTGIGMDDSFIEHVFEPFARETEICSEYDGSIGLGLAITKNLVNMMGGDIKVESRLGVGTKFIVSLPLLASKEDEEEIEEDNFSVETLQNEDFSGKRALLVEDNDLNAEIGSEVLKMTGITVERVADGQKAVDMFALSEQGYYDIIFMDIQMPGMNGYEATRAIRILDREDAKTIPIVALTANAFVSDVHEAKSAGMNEHLAKPIDFEKLCVTINKLLY